MFKKLVEDMRDELAMHQDQLPGGVGDDADPYDFDPHELLMGIAHEMEHTHDLDIAAEIAMDHLTENPSYYSELNASGVEHDAGDADGSSEDPEANPEQDDSAGGY